MKAHVEEAGVCDVKCDGHQRGGRGAAGRCRMRSVGQRFVH